MFTSGMELDRRAVCRAAKHYGIAAFICMVFGLIYERFSFGVYSPFMLGAFVIPLLLGVLPGLIALKRRGPIWASEAGLSFWRAGVMTLTAGSVVRGVLDIYGTESALLAAYPVLGAALLALSIACRFFANPAGKQMNRKES